MNICVCGFASSVSGAFYAMKAVLSYHHALSNSANRLPDIDYMLVVPFILVTSSTLSRSVVVEK